MFIIDFPLLLPPAIIGLTFLITWGSQGIIGKYLYQLGIQIPFNTRAVIMIMIFIGLPRFISGLLDALNYIDKDIVEYATLEGCTELELAYYITFPLIKKSIAINIWIAITQMLSEFGATMIFAGNIEGVTQTLSLAIYQSMDTNINQALLLSFTSILLILIIKFFVSISS